MPPPIFSAPTREQLRNRFTYHRPRGDQAKRHEAIRMGVLQLACQIVDQTPCTPEQSLALNALDDVMFRASAAIARGEMSIEEPKSPASLRPAVNRRTFFKVQNYASIMFGCHGRVLEQAHLAGFWWCAITEDAQHADLLIPSPPLMLHETEMFLEGESDTDLSCDRYLAQIAAKMRPAPLVEDDDGAPAPEIETTCEILRKMNLQPIYRAGNEENPECLEEIVFTWTTKQRLDAVQYAECLLAAYEKPEGGPVPPLPEHLKPLFACYATNETNAAAGTADALTSAQAAGLADLSAQAATAAAAADEIAGNPDVAHGDPTSPPATAAEFQKSDGQPDQIAGTYADDVRPIAPGPSITIT